MIENTNTEYKLQLEDRKPKSWLKTIVAFANTDGGHLIFGVTDDTRQIKGVSDAQNILSRINELIIARVTPIPRYSISETKGPDDEHPCIDVQVDHGPDYPYYYANEGIKEAYVRHGDRSEIARDHELRNLVLRGKNKTYDALESDKKSDDVSFTLLAAAYKKDNGETLVIPRDLISMNLMDINGIITNAGLLLSDQGSLRQSKIICTRWKGLTKGSVDGDALDDKEFKEASLISLLNDAEAFVRINSRNPWSVRGMKREEFSDYPFKAVREVLVNALIHRDYQIIGSEIHVDMYDDRLEVTSPGGMLNGKRIQDLDLSKIPSLRRNEIIADLFSRLHYMDRRGSGISRILMSYAGVRKQPDFLSDTDSFFVMLPNRRNETETSTFYERNSAKVEASMDHFSGKVEGSSGKVEGSSGKVEGSSGDPGKEVERSQTAVEETPDWELVYFTDIVMTKYKNHFRGKRREQLISLFRKYRYNYTFNRKVIAEAFELSENAASVVLNRCVEYGLIEKKKQGNYCFAMKK